MAVHGVQTAEEIQHLASLADGWADIVQRIFQLLETAGVLRDIHVTLNETAELSFEVDRVMQPVVAELVTDLGPDSMRHHLGSMDDGKEVRRDGIVQPAEDALISHAPVGIMALVGGRRRGEGRVEPKLADECIKEAAPLIIVWCGELECDRDMRLDVHRMEHGDGCGNGRSGGGVGLRRGGGVKAGELGIEEGVGIHSHEREAVGQWRKSGHAGEEGGTGGDRVGAVSGVNPHS